MEIIRNILVSKTWRPDTIGWHFTKSKKYMVKLGYYTEHAPSLSGHGDQMYRLDVRPHKLSHGN